MPLAFTRSRHRGSILGSSAAFVARAAGIALLRALDRFS
jgi:hypothetical protein